MKMISINQAAAQGITKLRMPKWANPADYLVIDIVDGKPGPWVHLYSPINEIAHGKNPMDILAGSIVPYDVEQFVLWEDSTNG